MSTYKTCWDWVKQHFFSKNCCKNGPSMLEDQTKHIEFSFGSFGKNIKLGNGVEIIGPATRIHLGDNVQISDGARLVCSDETSEILIGDGTIIQTRAILETGPSGSIRLGAFNSVNPYCVLYGHGGLSTGDYVRIAAHTVIIPANHIFDNPDVPIARQGLTKKGIRIGNDVWVASGCSILDGVEIGDGCVIAAGAVVNRSILPYSVVAGVPAKVIKMRTSNK